jgi:quaternary ammonium compound-resistance protein SugE
MNWVILIVAGVFETGWAIGLKYTDGFTRLWPTVWTVLSMIVSLWLLGIAVKSLPIGTAYGVWVGVGAVGTLVLGIVLLGEPVNLARMFSAALIIAGIVGLKLSA